MLARKKAPTPTSSSTQRFADVVALDGARVVVRLDGAAIVAERAVSCLVEPRVGDRVLLASGEGREHYVLAVLRREGASDVDVSAPGDLRVSLRAGRFEVDASEGVRIASREEVAVVAKEVRVEGIGARVAVERISALASVLEAHLGEVRTVAVSVDAVAERFVQRMKHALRFVEETDRTEAGEIAFRASGTITVEAHDAVVRADELVKIDGEQVHVG
jgi:hypothetical protein